MPNLITLDELIAAANEAKAKSPLGGGTVVHLCEREREYIAITDTALDTDPEQPEDGAVFLVCLDPAAPTKEEPKESPTLEDLLESWQVHFPGTWENDASPVLGEWYAVSNDDGIIAYFGNEQDAFRFRLAEINRQLNG